MTNSEITLQFRISGCSISEYKTDCKMNGMIYTRNKAKDVNFFPNWRMAYEHFKESNWLR